MELAPFTRQVNGHVAQATLVLDRAEVAFGVVVFHFDAVAGDVELGAGLEAAVGGRHHGDGEFDVHFRLEDGDIGFAEDAITVEIFAREFVPANREGDAGVGGTREGEVGGVCGGEAGGARQDRRSKKDLFHFVSLVFSKGAPQSRGIRIEYAVSSLFPGFIASAPQKPRILQA
ncbi:MAG TPA: hypothetical protein DIU07_02415 [Rhodobacteraceae bacterium]|nr:hypothetical protein [Paracoccaceae bacterium]